MAADPVEYYANEADEARVRIASTIDEIQSRFDPRRVIDSVVSAVSGGSSKVFGEARDQAKAHPLAIGASVAAIGLALLARRKLAGAKVNLNDDGTSYTDYDDGFGLDELQAGRFEDDGGAVAGGSGAERRLALAAQAEDSIESNPFAAILIGLAAGAALGALLPASDAERRVLSETSRRIGSAAKSAAKRAADDIGNAVDAVRSTASEARHKAGGAVDAARESLKS